MKLFGCMHRSTCHSINDINTVLEYVKLFYSVVIVCFDISNLIHSVPLVIFSLTFELLQKNSPYILAALILHK